MKRSLEIGGRKGLIAELVNRELGNRSLETCLGCSSCANACPVSGQDNMDPARFLQLILEDQGEDILNTAWIWFCSHCARCLEVCPMAIDIPSIVILLKSLKESDMLPPPVRRQMETWVSTGNTCSMHPKRYLELILKAQDLTRKRIGEADFNIPVDEKDKRILLLMDPEVLEASPEVLADYATLFYLAKESWSIPSFPLSTSDVSVITGQTQLGRLWQERVKWLAGSLAAEKVVIDDCQNSLTGYGPICGNKRSVWAENVTAAPFLIQRYLEEGRVRVRNRLKMSVTLQEPCSSIQNDFASMARGLLRQLCRTVIEMEIPAENSVCCGGGLLRAGLHELTTAYDVAKARQAEKSGAEAVVTLCSTCYLQFLRLKGRGLLSQRVLFLPGVAASAFS